MDAISVVLLVLLWFFLSWLVAVYAGVKGLSDIGYFFLSLLLSPVLGFVIAVVCSRANESLLRYGRLKECPHCGELVRPEAARCHYCGADLVASLAGAPAGRGRVAARPQRVQKSVVILGVLLFVGLLAAMGLFKQRHDAMVRNEETALKNIKLIWSAVATYESRCGSIPPSLEVLGPGEPQGSRQGSPNCTRAGLLDGSVISGRAHGYRVTYYLKKDVRGRIGGFEVRAVPLRPWKTGRKSYFVDDSGVVRSEVAGSIPGPDSPPAESWNGSRSPLYAWFG